MNESASQAGLQRAKGAVLISGATGLIGGALVPELEKHFEFIRILSRRLERNSNSQRIAPYAWNGVDPGAEAVRGTSAIVHLSGESIFGGLPTRARLDRIHDSRIDSTRCIVDRILALDPSDRPSVFVCASAVGIYGDRGEEELTEDSAPGEGFLADVCRAWEAEALRAREAGVRVVTIRIGVVLSALGGALPMMKRPFQLGVGGRLGSGNQYFPWIHLEDLISILVFAVDSPLDGAVNAVAPGPVTNLEFTKLLGKELRRPTLFPVPAFALKIGLGVLAGELLGSRRVRSSRLEEIGFNFRYPKIEGALSEALSGIPRPPSVGGPFNSTVFPSGSDK